jgi:hypothetical protein
MRLESTTLARVFHHVKGRESVLEIPIALREFEILVGFSQQKYNQFVELWHDRQPSPYQGGLLPTQRVRETGR